MKVVVIGTRGFPGVAGGVETHCSELYPRLAAAGVDVTVIRRSPYVTPSAGMHGVKFIDIYAPRGKYLEAPVHTLLALFKALRLKPDLLHIHAVGPSLFVPLARVLGMKVVMTHHGADYARGKWGSFARTMLRLGEKWGATRSNAVIAISAPIALTVNAIPGHAPCHLIPNGVNKAVPSPRLSFINSLGLTPGRYVLALGRFVEEKGFHDLVEAFTMAAPDGYNLVIAGDSESNDRYSRHLKALARQAGVVTPGFVSGEPLRQLLSHAALFAMPSYHEGLPIALLEALSYGLDVLVSDIEANRLPCLSPADFFPVGSVESLARKLQQKLRRPRRRTYNLAPYHWDHIAHQTLNVYQSIIE